MDNPQDYYHSFYYNVYIIISILSILFMITVVWKFSKQYQNGKGYMLVLIATFILVGIIYQTINPEIKIQRLIGSMSITYIYLYHNGLIYYVDGLTQLLNQRSFLNYTSNLKCISTIIIFDIDDFKALNDKYAELAKLYNMKVEDIKKALEPNKNEVLRNLRNELFTKFILENNKD